MKVCNVCKKEFPRSEDNNVFAIRVIVTNKKLQKTKTLTINGDYCFECGKEKANKIVEGVNNNEN
jgi:hypothetical protein